jgi:nucleoside-diphosphate-sugar epimerase
VTQPPVKQRPRVLVTGASGFIGGFVAEYLQANGCDVRAAMRTHRLPGMRVTECIAAPDFSKPFDAAPLVDGMDHIVHLAGLAHATETIPETAYMAINAESAHRLAAASRDADLKRFVFMSSVRAQTGPSALGVVTEAQLPAPTDAYGRSKLAGEQMLMDALAGSSTDAVVLRPVLVYGPGVKGNMASLMRLAQSPWPLPVTGLKARRSLVSRINLASAVLHAIVTPGPGAGPYLVADDEALTLAEILGALRHGLGRRPGTFRVPQKPIEVALRSLGRAGDLERITGDLCGSTEALRATGWRPPVSIREGLAAAIRDI